MKNTIFSEQRIEDYITRERSKMNHYNYLFVRLHLINTKLKIVNPLIGFNSVKII